MDTKIKEAAELYKVKFGVMPVDDGYLFSVDLGSEVCFARTEEALEAYTQAPKNEKYRGYLLYILCLMAWVILATFAICGKEAVIATFLFFIIFCFSYQRSQKKCALWQKKLWKGKVAIVKDSSVIKM